MSAPNKSLLKDGVIKADELSAGDLFVQRHDVVESVGDVKFRLHQRARHDCPGVDHRVVGLVLVVQLEEVEAPEGRKRRE